MIPYIHFLGKPISSYGAMMVLAVILVTGCATIRGRSRGLCVYDIFIVGAVSFGSALLGAWALYYLVTYPWAELWAHLAAGDLQFFLNGGLVFYGGLICGILGSLLGIRLAGCSLSLVEWTLVPLLPLGHSLGRVGCVLAGCCYGMTYEGPFALHYPGVASGRFPVQPLESLLDLMICASLLRMGKKQHKPFSLLFAYLAMYAVARFCLEFFRGDAERGIYFSLSVSQWISLGLLAVCWIANKLLRK